MGSRKDSEDKRHLVAFANKNKRVPVWVVMKTNRGFTQNPHQYNWRRSKLGKRIKAMKKASEGKR